jgi:hypothetical protein
MPVSRDELPPGVFFRLDIADPKERVAVSVHGLCDGRRLSRLIAWQAYIREYNTDHPLVDKSKPPSFDSIMMTNNVRVHSVSVGPPLVVVLELDIRPELFSRTGNLHGGGMLLVRGARALKAFSYLQAAKIYLTIHPLL